MSNATVYQSAEVSSDPSTATPAPLTTKAPRLSIIIPTYNRPDYVWPTVDQILHQDFTDFELLIIDQSPGSAGIHHSDPRVRYYRIPHLGLPTARNEGIIRARGEIILFLDDDVALPDRDFLDSHLVYYRDPEIGGVGGRIIDRVTRPNTKSTLNKITWTGRTLENLTGSFSCAVHSVRGANMSFRAQLFRQLGGFDPGYTGTSILEEADFATRVRADGWLLIFAPQACLVHLAAPTGGVRADAQAAEQSRFHNTGYYVAKHRGPIGLLPFIVMFSAIAVRRAWQWRDASAPLSLLLAIADGIRAGREIRAATLGADYPRHLPIG